MRNQFDKQLDELNVELITMGALCEEAITAAINAMEQETDNEAFRTKVSQTEAAINQKERDIESLCMKLLLRQQPVAKDLRTISSALKMISDMERIGDQAADIAEITRFLNGQHDSMSSQIPLKEMSASTIKMVSDSIDSFVKKDLALAGQVIAYDDVIDDYFNRIKANLIGLIRLSPESGETALDLLMIAKYLERIGDHATNIAEWVEYSVTGTHKGAQAE